MSGISTIGSSGEQHELAEYVDGLPNLSGAEALIAATIKDAARPGFPAAFADDLFAAELGDVGAGAAWHDRGHARR